MWCVVAVYVGSYFDLDRGVIYREFVVQLFADAGQPCVAGVAVWADDVGG